MLLFVPRWERPQASLSPPGISRGHHSPGRRHQDPLSHEATKVTEVTVVTVATTASTIIKAPCNMAATAAVTAVPTKAIVQSNSNK